MQLIFQQPIHRKTNKIISLNAKIQHSKRLLNQMILWHSILKDKFIRLKKVYA